jgi:hypothetical protein
MTDIAGAAREVLLAMSVAGLAVMAAMIDLTWLISWSRRDGVRVDLLFCLQF